MKLTLHHINITGSNVKDLDRFYSEVMNLGGMNSGGCSDSTSRRDSGERSSSTTATGEWRNSVDWLLADS